MNTLYFGLGPIGTGEIIVIVLVILIFFGGKRIPELMKGIGKGVKSFKDGISGIEDEINNAGNTDAKKDSIEK